MAAGEAIALGYGGVSLVRRACGLSRKAISKGIREIEEGSAPLEGRIRRSGSGRKPITVSDPHLVETLEEMIEQQTRGDPESPLRIDLQVADEARREVPSDVLEAAGRSEPHQAAGVETDPDVAGSILRERRRRGAVESLALPAALRGALQSLSQREGATLFMTLLAAFQTLLFRYTGQEDILVGSPVAGRDLTEIGRASCRERV